MLSRIFALIGIFFTVCFLYLSWERHTPRRLAFQLENQSAVRSSSGSIPKTLTITDLSLTLPIFAAEIQNGKWEATPLGVSHLASSPTPGEVGNSILYGHNWPNLLGGLSRVKPGQKIIVTDEVGKEHQFVVEFTQVVTPDQTHVLAPTNDRRITLYTCAGFLDTKRLVVTAIIADRTLTHK